MIKIEKYVKSTKQSKMITMKEHIVKNVHIHILIVRIISKFVKFTMAIHQRHIITKKCREVEKIMSYRRDVSVEEREKWINKIDELLDVQFDKTLKKIKEDIKLEVKKAIKRIKEGEVNVVKFNIKGYINFINLSSATLPIIMSEELTMAYVQASGWWEDKLEYFNNYTNNYNLYVFSSKKYGVHFYSFKFFKGENDSFFNRFLTRTGKKLCKNLIQYFEEKNIKLKFKCLNGYTNNINITVKCNKNSKI